MKRKNNVSNVVTLKGNIGTNHVNGVPCFKIHLAVLLISPSPMLGLEMKCYICGTKYVQPNEYVC